MYANDMHEDTFNVMYVMIMYANDMHEDIFNVPVYLVSHNLVAVSSFL